MGFHQETGPVIFPLIPQSITACYKVVSSSFEKDPRSDLSLEEEHVQNFILIVLANANTVLKWLLILVAYIIWKIRGWVQDVILDFLDQFGMVLLQTVEMRPQCSFIIFVEHHVRSLMIYRLH